MLVLQPFPVGESGEKYTLNKNFNDSSFTPEEIKTLHEVKEKIEIPFPLVKSSSLAIKKKRGRRTYTENHNL